MIVKKIIAPIKAPEILEKTLLINLCDISPITITLPHVKRIVPWKPIIRSVNPKQIINAGKNLIPNRAGI